MLNGQYSGTCLLALDWEYEPISTSTCTTIRYVFGEKNKKLLMYLLNSYYHGKISKYIFIGVKSEKYIWTVVFDLLIEFNLYSPAGKFGLPKS